MRPKSALVWLFLAAGCALYSDVEVAPLELIPANIERGSDLQSMIRKNDYLRMIELAPTIDARPKPNPVELGALGSAYLAAGRYDDARGRLRAALNLDPFRSSYAQIAWDLSQVEYLANNYESSLEWAKIAVDRGLNIRRWHIDYLTAMAKVPAYEFSGATHDRLPFHFTRPEVPRVNVRLNGTHEMEAVIDSGAVLSIVSKRLAASLPVKSLGAFEGTFYGLLGEPIAVNFGLIEQLQIGEITIHNVPVAIMPDEKMRFLVSRKERQEFRIDFLLGSNLLKEFRLDLDFGARRVTFKKLTAADHHPDSDQNLFMYGFRPHVRGAINRRGWFLFILDTGSEITFLNEGKLSTLPVHVFGTTGVHSATLQGLGGAMKHGSKLENVEIGVDKWSGKFETLPMYVADERDTSVGIIGQNFMKHFNVVIDFGRMRVDLVPR
jgi:tetratricopeptide (TPR) repeat protein